MGITYKKEENDNMNDDLLMVLNNLSGAITSILNSVLGKLMVLLALMLSYFSSIAGLIHIVLALVIIDLIMGVTVSVRVKGKGSILSSKLRNTLFKLFFYLFFIVFTFMIERQVTTDIECFTPKLVFAIISAVELFSIMSNALILNPSMSFLRIFSKYLTRELSKKLGLTVDEVEEFLNYKTKDDKKKRDNEKRDK